jgi:hypothetical protein
VKIAAVLMIVLALVIGIVPQFTDCESHGRALTLANGREIPMKCHWTARAEIAVAGPLLATGILLFTSKRKENQRTLAAMGAVLGVFVVLLPTALVGVCANPEMICNAVMKPTLILSGSGVGVLSAAGFVMTLKKEEAAWALQS